MNREIAQYIRACIGVTLLIAVSFLLAGCAATPVARIDNPTPLEVKVPVPVPCVENAAVPTMPPMLVAPLTGDAREDSTILARSLLTHRSALDRALALLSACTKD